MQIQVNGEPEEVAGELTVSELLESLDINGRRLAIELNGAIVPRSAHAAQRLVEGDRLEIVHAIGGGG